MWCCPEIALISHCCYAGTSNDGQLLAGVDAMAYVRNDGMDGGESKSRTM